MQNSSHKSPCVLVTESKGISQPCIDIFISEWGKLLPWLAWLQLELGYYLGFFLKHWGSEVLDALKQNEAMFLLPAIMNEELKLSASPYQLNRTTWRSLTFLCLRMLVTFAQVHPSFNLWESLSRVRISRYNLKGFGGCGGGSRRFS